MPHSQLDHVSSGGVVSSVDVAASEGSIVPDTILIYLP